jgi:hypothetical protein
MPVGACWSVIGQVKNREAIRGSFLVVGGSTIRLSATDAWFGPLSVMEQAYASCGDLAIQNWRPPTEVAHSSFFGLNLLPFLYCRLFKQPERSVLCP